MSKRAVIIIPARFKSSRFPGKPLTMISGKSMIHRVWERCISALPKEDVYVATDSTEIESHCKALGANVLMTSSECLTGTDRISEASKMVDADCYINVQGDEPLIVPKDILTVRDAFLKNPKKVFCAMSPIDNEEEFRSLTVPKVVVRPDHSMVYMSRSGIPGNKEARFVYGHKQVCIYGFSKEHLKLFGPGNSKTPLEEQEDIEILRFLESGVDIQMVPVAGGTIAVDTPQDVARVEKILRST